MRTLQAAVLAVTVAFHWAAYASPQAQGLKIAQEADRRDTGFKDSTANMVMVLKNRQGQQSRREIRVNTLEGTSDGDKSLIIFDSPRDVKGTALLTFTHKKGDDDQWLFLPALKRVKRIASANQSGPFMGSEFAYEDFNSQEVDKYTYKYIKDENLKGKDCFVIERYPVNKNSGYTRQVVWLDKDEYRIWKVVFYDRKGAKLKTLDFKNYKQYLNKFWRPDVMMMQNHQTGKSTDLIWSNFKFRTGLKDSDFTRASLKRAR